MAKRTSNQSNRNQVHVEVDRWDEMQQGQPDPKRAEQAAIVRAPGGRIADTAGAKALGSIGGSMNAGQAKLARRLGLRKLPDGCPFGPYHRSAVGFKRFHVGRLARLAGGGQCGAGPASVVGTAAWQLAASRYIFDLVAAGELDVSAMKLASQLGNDSRQNLLASWEMAVQEGAALKASKGNSNGLPPPGPVHVYTPEELAAMGDDGDPE